MATGNSGFSLILDSSAIVEAILKGPEATRIVGRLDEADSIGVGTATLVETAIVLSVKLGDARPLLREFLRHTAAELIPVEQVHFDAAVSAYLRFGKGRHRAGLNFGDCLSYAVASVAGAPLLFTGKDFTFTDIKVA